MGLARQPNIRNISSHWLWLGAYLLLLLPLAVISHDLYIYYLILSSAVLLGMAAFVKFFNHGGLGLTLILVFCLLFPLQIGPLPMVALLVMGFSTLFVFKIGIQRRKVSISRPMGAALAFMMVATLAFITGQFPWHPTEPAPFDAQVGGLGIFLISGSTFLLMAFELKSIKVLKRLTFLFLLVAGILAFTHPFFGEHPLVGTIRGTLGALFWVWFVAVALGQAIFNQTLSRKIRLILIALVVFSIAHRTVTLTSQVSGWLPMIATAGIFLFLARPVKAVGLAVVGGIVCLLNFNLILSTLLETEAYSLESRLAALWTLLEVVKVNPILGVGPANYYYYTKLYTISGWYVEFNSHNNYLDLLLQTGILGVLSFLWFSLETACTGWKLRFHRLTGFENGYVHACLAGLVGTLVAGLLGDWFLPFVYNIGLEGLRSSLLAWFFLGGMVALARIIREAPDRRALPQGIPAVQRAS